MKSFCFLNRVLSFSCFLITVLGFSNFSLAQNVTKLDTGLFDLDFNITQEAQVGIDSFVYVSSAELKLLSFEETQNNFVLRFADLNQINEDSSFIEEKNSKSLKYATLNQAKNLRIVLEKTPIETPEHRYVKKSLKGILVYLSQGMGANDKTLTRINFNCVLQNTFNKTFYCKSGGWNNNSSSVLLGDLELSTKPRQ